MGWLGITDVLCIEGDGTWSPVGRAHTFSCFSSGRGCAKDCVSSHLAFYIWEMSDKGGRIKSMTMKTSFCVFLFPCVTDFYRKRTMT